VADHYPTLVKEGQSRGAEFIAHGLSRRRIIHIGISEDEKRQYIRASVDAVQRAAGTRPVGWSGPDFLGDGLGADSAVSVDGREWPESVGYQTKILAGCR
jgi:peptidoglycan/xylan/chitin deacetylase (PgdA/CDA1 family)